MENDILTAEKREREEKEKALEQRNTESSNEVTLEVSDERCKHFRKMLYALMIENQAQSLEMSMIIEYFKIHETKQPFTQIEIDEILKKMEEENNAMRSGETVYII